MAPREFRIGLDDNQESDYKPLKKEPTIQISAKKKASVEQSQPRSKRARAGSLDHLSTGDPDLAYETWEEVSKPWASAKEVSMPRASANKVSKPRAPAYEVSKPLAPANELSRPRAPVNESKPCGSRAAVQKSKASDGKWVAISKKLERPQNKITSESDDGKSLIPKQEKIDSVRSSKIPKRKATAIENESSKMVVVESYDQGMSQSATSCNSTNARPEEVTAEMDWPGNDENRSKVPSILAYREENPGAPGFECGTNSVFGFEVVSGMQRHAFAKATIDDDAPTSRFDDGIFHSPAGENLMAQPSGITATEVFTEIYRHLHKIQTERFIKENGSKSLIDTKRIIVLTFPVACSFKGRQNILKAALDAGMNSRRGDEICMISEAEAAAVATFFSRQKRFGGGAWKHVYKEKSLIMVVDIGGLTVDVATFSVIAISPQLKLKERCIPEGAKCGIMSMYCRLLAKLIEMFGENVSRLSRERIGCGSPLLEAFEKALRRFNLHQTQEVRLPLSFDDENFRHGSYDYEDGEIILTPLDIKEIMDVTVKKILDIIKSQIAQAKQVQEGNLESIILCGGGSLMEYILETVRKFGKTWGLEILRPDDPQSIVTRGATMAFLRHRVVQLRKARACFGIKVHKAWDGGVWEDRFIFDCPVGGKRVDGFVSWHIHRGDEISINAQKKLHGYSTLTKEDLDNSERSFMYKIYTYEGEEPWPTRITDPGVRELGSFLLKLSEMTAYKKDQVKELLEGSMTAKVDIQVQQLCDSLKGVLEFQVKITGGTKSIGKYELQYDDATQTA